MTSVAERMRALKSRLGQSRTGSSPADKAERARRRAEAKALRLEHKRKMTDHGGGG